MPIVIALVVVVVAEFGVRAASSTLSPLNTWNDWEATNKVQAMDALAKRGGASVVFVGSSMVNAAADPALYSRLSGANRPAFNAALNGSGALLMDLWTLRVVVPKLKPDTVVIGVSSRDLNDNGRASNRAYRAIRRSPGGRTVGDDLSLTERVQSIAERASYLVRYRSVLRKPATMTDVPVAKRRSEVGPLGSLAGLRIFVGATYREELYRGEKFPESLGGFVMGGTEFDALGHLVRTLVERKIDVVLVEMPVTEDAVTAHPGGAGDYERFEAILGLFTRFTQLVDADAWFPTNDGFGDPFHLNDRGREVFTRSLAAAVSQTG